MLQILVFVLAFCGLYLLLLDLCGMPSFACSAAIAGFARGKSRSFRKLEGILQRMANRLAKVLKLSAYRREELESNLRSAGIRQTPEQYTAECILSAAVILLAAVPVYFLFPPGIIAVLLLAAGRFVTLYRKPGKMIAGKRKKIEAELPLFVSHTEKTLLHSRDVLSLLENYIPHAGEEFANELQITAADMRSGNYEAALVRLESRVGSSMLSDVSRGLIGVLRGDDTVSYWQSLEIKFSDIQRQLLKREAGKIPGKVKKLSMCMLFCFILLYLVVMGTEIVDSLGILFG